MVQPCYKIYIQKRKTTLQLSHGNSLWVTMYACFDSVERNNQIIGSQPSLFIYSLVDFFCFHAWENAYFNEHYKKYPNHF